MSVTFKVSPEKFQRKADEISVEILKIEDAVRAIGEQVRSSANYWEGDGSDVHRKLYAGLEESLQAAVAELKENPGTLLKRAGLDMKSDAELREMHPALPTDVIS